MTAGAVGGSILTFKALSLSLSVLISTDRAFDAASLTSFRLIKSCWAKFALNGARKIRKFSSVADRTIRLTFGWLKFSRKAGETGRHIQLRTELTLRAESANFSLRKSLRFTNLALNAGRRLGISLIFTRNAVIADGRSVQISESSN